MKVRKYIRIIKKIREKNKELVSILKKIREKSELKKEETVDRIQCTRATLFHEYTCAILRKEHYLKRFLDLKKLGYTDKSINIPSTSSLQYIDFINNVGELDELTPKDLREFVCCKLNLSIIEYDTNTL